MTGTSKVEKKYIGISTYVLLLGLLHPGVLVALGGQGLVHVLKREPQAAGVDLSVGEVELLAGFLVLGLGEVAVHDAKCIVVGHLALSFVTLRLARGFQGGDLVLKLEDQSGEFNEVHLRNALRGFHYNLQVLGEINNLLSSPTQVYNTA